MVRLIVALFVFSVFLALIATAQGPGAEFVRKGNYGQQAVVLLSSDKLQLTLAVQGGSMLDLIMQDDLDKLSPYGNPDRIPAADARGGNVYGHFVCVDGFGGTSAAERAAGLPGHGEAHTLPWDMVSSVRDRKVGRAVFSVKLPLVQEIFTRTIQMVDGENVIYVDSTLESLLGFDRPINWAEHLTLGAPFLEPEKTAVDLAGSLARTRVHPAPGKLALPHRLASDADFSWPDAPLLSGGRVNLRTVPSPPDSGDEATVRMDPRRPLAFITAINTARGYLLGYVFRTSEFAWVQDWEDYPPSLRLNRGLEFATQPFDVPRRETIELRSMLNAPTYRWLPAKSRIAARFLLFWVKAPTGMRKVDDVKIENGRIIITDVENQKRLELAASLPI